MPRSRSQKSLIQDIIGGGGPSGKVHSAAPSSAPLATAPKPNVGDVGKKVKETTQKAVGAFKEHREKKKATKAAEIAIAEGKREQSIDSQISAATSKIKKQL